MGLHDVQQNDNNDDGNETGEPVPGGHLLVLGFDELIVFHEVEASLAALVDIPLQPDQGRQADQDASHDGQSGSGGGLSAVELHGDQVLDLGRAGDSSHGDAESTAGDGAGQLGAGDISSTVDSIAHGIDNEHDDEQGNAAVGHQHAGENDSQHGVLGADPADQLGAEGTGGTGQVHDLAVNSAQHEGGEPGLEVVSSALHVGVGVRIQQVQAAAQSDERSADRRDPDDGVAAESQEHQQSKADENSS